MLLVVRCGAPAGVLESRRNGAASMACADFGRLSSTYEAAEAHALRHRVPSLGVWTLCLAYGSAEARTSGAKAVDALLNDR